jgi:hypothetical protein
MLIAIMWNEIEDPATVPITLSMLEEAPFQPGHSSLQDVFPYPQ